MAGDDHEKFRLEQIDGMYVLSGSLDEFADLSLLTTALEPLRIDLRQVSSLNSLGSRRWLKMIKGWGKRKIELFGCPPIFVSLFNSVPGAIGADELRGNVRSVLLPYTCERCHFYSEVEMTMESLVVGSQGIEVPEGACQSCGEPARLIVDPDDYFIFLTD